MKLNLKLRKVSNEYLSLKHNRLCLLSTDKNLSLSQKKKLRPLRSEEEGLNNKRSMFEVASTSAQQPPAETTKESIIPEEEEISRVGTNELESLQKSLGDDLMNSSQ